MGGSHRSQEITGGSSDTSRSKKQTILLLRPAGQLKAPARPAMGVVSAQSTRVFLPFRKRGDHLPSVQQSHEKKSGPPSLFSVLVPSRTHRPTQTAGQKASNLLHENKKIKKS